MSKMLIVLSLFVATVAEAGTAAPTTGLKMPAAERCVAAPDPDSVGGDGFTVWVSEGLDSEIVSATTSSFLPNFLRCLPAEGSMSGRVVLSVNVGCDGRVARVVVAESAGMSADTLACMVKTAAYMDFPAHDLPEGLDFDFPVRLSR